MTIIIWEVLRVDLRLIAFLSFIFVSLILSIWLEVKMQKNTNNKLAAISIAFNSNILVLGSASLWWLFNADESVSVFSGMYYLLTAFFGIFIINIFILLFLKNKAV